jgi:competence protein ComEA
VHVVGAVRRPGVYELPEGARVQDAVVAAGGVTRGAASEAVNLAQRVQDGEQVVVPTRDEVASGGGAVAGVRGAGRGTGAGSAVQAAGAPAARVNINTADATQLDALPGIGPSTAAKIVADRLANGPFSSADDLARIPGIGPKRIEQMKDLVCVR